MAVVRSPEPSMPTPTIPKRTRSLAAAVSCDANNGSESRKIDVAANVAPAAPAVVCKNSRREKLFLFMLAISLALFSKSALRDLKIRGVLLLGNADKPQYSNAPARIE